MSSPGSTPPVVASGIWPRPPLSPGGEETADQGCVAVAHHPDGWVALADTKIDLAGQAPLMFLPEEWRRFTDAVRAGRV
jgi:Domain of unknown function (DUF397)